ncbi:hypothetical protein [Halpernia frigidisoli]|uniref:Uncharacterized protein n=1 Tax=Halpernia frigidisoli TaxID=1125876 RepID=A0A1I3H4F6_9FLAO|nr:hypothetical protein [Halpernia frigidisoli]SFI30645.1 hypothetical protein SAMN05443292_2186 [Halpernia frigidisoli]
MSKLMKRIIIRLAILFVGLISFVGYGMYLMDIEDRYGDLQQIYFDSKSHDIIINNLNGKTGIIKLENRRIYVKTGKQILDIDEWLDPENKFMYNIDIYRPENPNEFLNLKMEKFKQKVASERLKSISHLEVKY